MSDDTNGPTPALPQTPEELAALIEQARIQALVALQTPPIIIAEPAFVRIRLLRPFNAATGALPPGEVLLMREEEADTLVREGVAELAPST